MNRTLHGVCWNEFRITFVCNVQEEGEKPCTKAYEIRRMKNVGINKTQWCNKENFSRNVANNNNDNNIIIIIIIIIIIM